MGWFIVSVFFVVAAIIIAFCLNRHYKAGRILQPLHILLIGVVLALFVGMIPGFRYMLNGEPQSGLKLFLINFDQCIQALTANADSGFILENINENSTAFSAAYSTYLAFLYVAAPLLTAGFILSFFRNISARVRCFFSWWKDIYVLSEINEKSLQLARSLRKKHPKAVILFTDTAGKEDKDTDERLEQARELKAIVLNEDITTIDFSKHSAKHSVALFTIGEDESRNVRQALKLISVYKERRNTNLYVLSCGTEGELLLSGADTGEIRLRRVDDVRSAVYHMLWKNGEELFENAKQVSETEKTITIVIAGLGRYGTELLKAMSWYCQMTGYSVTIHAFDEDEQAEDIITAKCPELLSAAYNGVRIPGESEYTIRIHSGTDVRTRTFADELSKIPGITSVYVCLGSDRENIEQAANIRMLCERAGCKPMIKAVVYDPEAAKSLKGITNYRKQPYNIGTIGTLDEVYSEEVLMSSKLEQEALRRHLKWGNEDEFWRYEYNFRSSMASAVHREARIACGIPGAEKQENTITDEEREGIEQLEHRRWNTYMRSEGYVYSGSSDKKSRNDLAKMHHDLVDFASLSEEEKRKDSRVGLN